MFDFQILYCVTAIVWYYYASLEGIIESHYFHKNKLANDFNNKLWLWDIHVWFSFRRGLVAFLLLVIDYLILKYFGFTPLQILFSMVMKSLSFILSFPMFHNGFYYIARKKMDPAQQFTGFRTDDFTNDSSAKINLGTFLTRWVSFILSVLLIVITLFFKIKYN